jgi:hypothetical protein
LTRVIAYLVSVLAAWLVYFSCIAVMIPGPGSISARLLAALVFSLVGGFSAALVLIALPWTFAVWTLLKFRKSGPAFLACIGALLMVFLGCTSSSLAWKPLFIEDQTFLEGVLVALKRQGVILAFSGATVGFVYWLLAERLLAGENALALLASGNAALRLAALGGSDPQAEGAPQRRVDK